MKKQWIFEFQLVELVSLLQLNKRFEMGQLICDFSKNIGVVSCVQPNLQAQQNMILLALTVNIYTSEITIDFKVVNDVVANKGFYNGSLYYSNF